MILGEISNWAPEMHDAVAGIEAIQIPFGMGLAPLTLLHRPIMCLEWMFHIRPRFAGLSEDHFIRDC
jgi:hypothetical protein